MQNIDIHFFDDRPALVVYQDIPARYDFPYPGEVVEFSMPSSRVEAVCGAGVDACTLIMPNFSGDRCYTVMPLQGRGGVSKRTLDYLRRHENAHCNGWSKDHEPE